MKKRGSKELKVSITTEETANRAAQLGTRFAQCIVDTEDAVAPGEYDDRGQRHFQGDIDSIAEPGAEAFGINQPGEPGR